VSDARIACKAAIWRANWRGSRWTGGASRTRKPWFRDVRRIRDVRQGPDGLTYLAIDDEGRRPSVVRLEPVSGN
jgi:glucose/arabinose dehydrogenase